MWVVFCHNFHMDMILHAPASIVNCLSWLAVVTAAMLFHKQTKLLLPRTKMSIIMASIIANTTYTWTPIADHQNIYYHYTWITINFTNLRWKLEWLLIKMIIMMTGLHLTDCDRFGFPLSKMVFGYLIYFDLYFVVNTKQKTHLHTNCNITDAERENHMVKIRRFKMGKIIQKIQKGKASVW